MPLASGFLDDGLPAFTGRAIPADGRREAFFLAPVGVAFIALVTTAFIISFCFGVVRGLRALLFGVLRLLLERMGGVCIKCGVPQTRPRPTVFIYSHLPI